MKKNLLIILAFFVLQALFLPSVASAQDAAVCDPAAGCFNVSLPLALTGDLYVNGNLIVAAVNNAHLTLAANTPYQIEFRNLQDPTTPGFGDLFVYPDQSQAGLSTTAGRTRPVIFRPTKQYIKGILEITCDPRGRKAQDSVACRPTIDGTTQADVAAGAKATYTLLAGAHAVHTDLVGDQANNWSPIVRDDTVTINAGLPYVRTTSLRASFTLKGLLKISLFPKGVVADLYLNGSLLASQVSSLDIYVASGTHVVEARAVTDPTAGGQYVYGDYSTTVTISAASVRPAILRPPKNWLVGFLVVTCQINQKLAAEDVRCLVKVDGVDLGTVESRQRQTFTLPVGPHTLVVSTTGANARKWDGPVSSTINLLGGRNTYNIARFNVRVCLAQPGDWSSPPEQEVTLTVSDCSILDFLVVFTLNDGRVFVLFPLEPAPIINNRFAYDTGDLTFKGVFTSRTQASGTWSALIEGQQYGGEWSATPE